MSTPTHTRRSAPLLAGLVATVLTILFLAATGSPTQGDDHPWESIFHKHFGHEHVPPGQIETLNGGAWYWMRSPEQEKTVVMNLFNRYCIRCHGVDGRGVWTSRASLTSRTCAGRTIGRMRRSSGSSSRAEGPSCRSFAGPWRLMRRGGSPII